MESPSVTVVGHVTHDRYADEVVAGGCAYYGARIYRALGWDVTLCTTVGEDFRCDADLVGLARVERRAGKTTVFTNLYPAQGPRLQRVDAQAGSVVPPANLPPADLLHLAPVMGEVDLVAWKRWKQSARLAISVQGWIKGAVERDESSEESRTVVPRPWPVTVEELRGIDVACLSEEDLIGQGDLLARLCAAVPVVALTLGARGCELHVDGRRHHVGTYCTVPHDPTGAGDTFAAVFLAHLVQGANACEAAQMGAAAASVVIESKGATGIERVPHEMGARARQIPMER